MAITYEMFEKLEYKKYISDNKTRIKYIYEGCDIIKFDCTFKLVKVEIFNGINGNFSKNIDMQELQAIMKKCEELGWIDNKSDFSQILNSGKDIKIVENYLTNSAINETDSDFFKNGGWEIVELEIPKAMKHIVSEYKRVLKENEELKDYKERNEYTKKLCKSKVEEAEEKLEKMKKKVRNNNMKVMISQPMNGKTVKKIAIERRKVVEKLESLGWEVVDTIFAEEPPKDCNSAIWYLAKSIDVISKVDAVMFMNGWQNARGCKIEHEICQKYEKPTMYEYEV